MIIDNIVNKDINGNAANVNEKAFIIILLPQKAAVRRL